jgi:hypothetical protein
VLLSLAEFKNERLLKKERAFSCTSFRKKKLLNFKRESTPHEAEGSWLAGGLNLQSSRKG